MDNNESKAYNPADDDNQGVVQLMAQGSQSNEGVAQAEQMNPVTASGPEPEKAEVNDDDTIGVNDDVLTEEEVEDGEADATDE